MRPSNNLENKTLIRHILGSSVSLCESSGSQFFRTTTGKESGPDFFDESRFVMTLLTILGVTEILYSLRVVQDENTISNSPKVPRAKFLESDRLSCFISTCKFGSFKNPFAAITSLSELYFRLGRFILLVQTKEMISMNYGSSTSC